MTKNPPACVRRPRHPWRAFTLVELIVVIVIMGILVAVGAFAYNSILQSSRKDAATKSAGQFAATIQAVSAAESRSATDLSDSSKNAAIAEATAAGTTVVWPAGVNVVQVKKGEYCTPVTLAPGVGQKASVGAPTRAGSCAGAAGAPATIPQNAFFKINVGIDALGKPYSRSFDEPSPLTTGGAYTVNGRTFAKSGPMTGRWTEISLWDNIAAVPDIAKISFTATTAVPTPTGQPADTSSTTDMYLALNLYVKGTVEPDSAMADKLGSGWVGKEVAMLIPGAKWDTRPPLKLKSNTALATSGTFTRASAQSAYDTAVQTYAADGLNITGVLGVGMTIQEPLDGNFEGIKVENVTGSAK
jgi:prepilin-type N-terminal cleavage/methylation domain-containing protein